VKRKREDQVKAFPTSEGREEKRKGMYIYPIWYAFIHTFVYFLISKFLKRD